VIIIAAMISLMTIVFHELDQVSYSGRQKNCNAPSVYLPQARCELDGHDAQHTGQQQCGSV
jgi:hypothetical protein